jgi:proline dehydrogenase
MLMGLMRHLLLASSTSRWLREHATRAPFVKRSVRRFMPGERIEDALAAAAGLAPQGIATILTALGENLTSPAEADEVGAHYCDVFQKVAAARLDAHVSIKPTQLGLDFDDALAERHLDRLLDCAERCSNFLWIDMESSPYVDRTLALYRRARSRSARVGVALQAYLYRTAQDLEALLPLGPAIRIVKGAYLEPDHLAYPRRADVDENFYRLCVRLMSVEAQRAGALVHVATHDTALARRVIEHARQHDVPRSAYEIAMLYGIGAAQQRRLVAEGQSVRVLISYGEHWFPWYMRRLAERPANVWFVVKNAFA